MASDIATPIHQIEFRGVKFSQIETNLHGLDVHPYYSTTLHTHAFRYMLEEVLVVAEFRTRMRLFWGLCVVLQSPIVIS